MEYRITALMVQKRNPQRVNVYLDGEFGFGLARLTAAWLSVGQTLDDERIAGLKLEDEYESAYQRALKYINFRQRSREEIRRKLKEYDCSDDLSERIMERLTQLGLVDDNGFAQAWVENRNEFRPRSRRALSVELRQRGIDDQTITQTLEAIDEEALAYSAARKQVRKLANLDWQNFRLKLSSFLARRGFEYQVISPVVTRIWAELQTENITDEIEDEVEE
jgi:regulatory protein